MWCAGVVRRTHGHTLRVSVACVTSCCMRSGAWHRVETVFACVALPSSMLSRRSSRVLSSCIFPLACVDTHTDPPRRQVAERHICQLTVVGAYGTTHDQRKNKPSMMPKMLSSLFGANQVRLRPIAPRPGHALSRVSLPSLFFAIVLSLPLPSLSRAPSPRWLSSSSLPSPPFSATLSLSCFAMLCSGSPLRRCRGADCGC